VTHRLSGRPERVRAGCCGFTGQRGQILARLQDDGLNPSCPRLLGNPGARGLAVARPGVDEQHWPARRINRPPALT
jgi:hypothetical protein